MDRPLNHYFDKDGNGNVTREQEEFQGVATELTTDDDGNLVEIHRFSSDGTVQCMAKHTHNEKGEELIHYEWNTKSGRDYADNETTGERIHYNTDGTVREIKNKYFRYY